MNPILAFSLAPERASDIASSLDAIFYTLVVVCGLVTALIALAIVVFCVRYRQGSPAVRTSHHGTSVGLEITWTGLTLAAFVGIFVWAAVLFVHMSRPPGNATEIHVIGKQWMWTLQHANGRREINELHIAVGHPIKLVMGSEDVIHDFSIPAFRTKQDVVPGRYTTQWFTPTKTGSYRIFCSEYCGMAHSGMIGWVHVMEAREHAAWLAQGNNEESVAAAGARLFRSRGCSGCHAPNAAIRAPLLEGIFGKPVALAGGEFVIADEQYIHDSILLPMKQIVAGYAPIMPTFQGQLSNEELMQLVSYIKSMGDAPGGNSR